ncbi:InlB B-repeat-containing protein [Paenibacillus arenilitoris]|uniref:exo-alpha-sialidase n=1 Tax=Paenibacillus arenilitoris TaxID=2772299 RepID=A0A927CLW4_9BACL|nr:LamG-like jellyroll fold domain-containing protein [Paenibacillus arenilitoris]MBD2868988.1 S-layer homology domain-containing protein [Paenibacillus arenilitoris]
MNNPVMIAEKDANTVHLLYSKEYAETFHLKSTDGGATWTNPLDPQSSEPENITDVFRESEYEWRVVAVGPGHGIQLENGRLLAAVWMANGGAAQPTAHSPSVVSSVYSDNLGETWHMGEIIAADSPELSNPNESALVELSDGRVMINMRNNDSGNRRAVSVSANGISGWSTPVFDEELVDPLCFGSIVRYDENRILFVNANSETAREHLTLRMSEDNGQTWAYSRLLQLGGAAYSDIAVGPDKSIYVFYERDPYKFLTVKKFDLEWLTSPPPMAQLNDIEIPGADFAPTFISEVYDYDVRVDATASTISVTPVAYPNSNPEITINGEPARSGEVFEVEIPGESAEIRISVTANEQTNTYTLHPVKKRLVTNWKFEKSDAGKLRDSSGFGNEAVTTFRGIAFEQGYIGKALKFDDLPTGQTTQERELLDVPGIDATKFGTGDFAVSAWINADDVIGGQHILFWYGRNTSDISQWWVRIKPNAAAGRANLEFSNGNKPGGVGVEINAGTTDAPIQAGVWHHIVVQRKNGIMEIYVDGVRKVRKGSTPVNISRGPETNLYVGRAKSGDRGWLGKMDEIRMYNYGLSQAEIQTLSGMPSVDTTALEAKMGEAKALNANDYPAEAWANLQAVLTAADVLLDSEAMTQANVNHAEGELQAAISELEPGYPVTVRVSPEEGGSVAGDIGYSEQGDSVTLTAAANTDYRFVNWTKDGVEVGANPTYTFTMGAQAVNLTANFEMTITRTVAVSANPANGGRVTGGGEYVQGSSVTVSAEAEAGYQFVNWTQSGTAVSDNPNYTFVVGAEDVELTAHYVKQQLVANWKFERPGDSGIHDSSGRGNDSAVINGAAISTGYIGKSIAFSDSSHYIDVTGSDDGGMRFGTGDFTVTAWVQANQLDGQRFLFWYGELAAPVSQWWARTSGTAVQFSTGFSGTETIVWTANDAIKQNEWTHLAFQRKENQLYIYVNGEEIVNKASLPLHVSGGSNTLRIGKARSGADRPWNGKIDEVRLYNYGLDAEDIRALASQTSVDTSLLDAALIEAGLLNEADYSPQSWAALQMAVTAAEAELDDDALTQEGIDEALAGLQAGMAALVAVYPVDVTASPAHGGTVGGAGSYAEGDSVEVTAAANPGYRFVSWTIDGAEAGTGASYTFTMGTEAVHLVAGFAAVSGGSGDGTPPVAPPPSDENGVTEQRMEAVIHDLANAASDADAKSGLTAAIAIVTELGKAAESAATTADKAAAAADAARLVGAAAFAIDKIEDPKEALNKTVGIIQSASAVIRHAEAAGISGQAVSASLWRAADKAMAKWSAEPVQPVVAEGKSSAVIDDHTAAALVARMGDIRHAADQLNKELGAAGADAQVDAVLVIKAAGLADVKEAETRLPAHLIAQASDHAIGKIVIDTGIAKVAVVPETIVAKDDEAVALTVTKADASELSAEVQAAAGSSSVYDFKLVIGDAEISRFGQPLDIALPYTLKPGENPNKMTVLYINDSGELENMAGVYDEATGWISFKTSHFSYYDAMENDKTFADLGKVGWARDAIETLAARGIIDGTGKNAFEPSGYVTRAQFAALLVRAFQLMDNDAVSSFNDVSESDWFYEEVASAVQAELIEGSGEGSFNPNGYITRQDMSVMIGRALIKLKGKSLPAETNPFLEKYADASQISDYAKNLAALSVKYAILEGRSATGFAPKSLSTRAEAAVIIARLLELR